MKKLAIIFVWSVAFAYVEAAVVEYLRALYHPLENGGFSFPLLTLEQFGAMGGEHLRRIGIEFGREIATLVMLAAVGFIAGKNSREKAAYFIFSFGVWDIFYYVWLKVLLGWPEGLMTWDLLFLIPVPWVAPVVAPLIVSAFMIAAGTTVLLFESRGREPRIAWLDRALIAAGGVMTIVAFCWDYRNIMAGGFPNPFNWLLFSAGLAVWAGSCVVILRRGAVESR
jgi:hypothetical protein